MVGARPGKKKGADAEYGSLCDRGLGVWGSTLQGTAIGPVGTTVCRCTRDSGNVWKVVRCYVPHASSSRSGFVNGQVPDLRKRMQQRACFGTFLKLARPEVVDLLVLAGFDFVICDMEHAQITEEEARGVIRASVAADLPVVVRVPDPTQGLVNRLLEAGAAGIQLPRLRRAADTQRLHAMMHFPPVGSRSVGTANALAGYGTVSIDRYMRQADSSVLVVGQFETAQMEVPFEPMFEHLDVAFIGPTDLSVDLGAPGRTDDPAVLERIQLVEDVANQSTTFLGVFVGSVDQARRHVESGYRYIAVSGDVTMLGGAAKGLVLELHEAADRAAGC